MLMRRGKGEKCEAVQERLQMGFPLCPTPRSNLVPGWLGPGALWLPCSNCTSQGAAAVALSRAVSFGRWDVFLFGL